MKKKLSIITINYNNAAGLKKTIESVIHQRYSDFEFIVIDGGSTDGSAGLLTEYKNNITYSVSEKDKGIYDAMNKGIEKANGEYLQFLNSGDYLFETTTLENVVSSLNGTDIVYGNLKIEKDNVLENGFMPNTLTVEHMVKDTLWHPVSFIKKELFKKFGTYNTNYKIVADYDFFFKTVIFHKCSTQHINQFIAVFDLNGLSSDIKNAPLIKAEKENVQSQYLSPEQLQAFKKPEEKKGFITTLFNKWFR